MQWAKLGWRAMETACTTSNNLPWILTWTPPRMSNTNGNSRKALDAIAASIKKLSLHLESSEIEGRQLTATEIHTIASKLQTHVEELVAASKSLRDEASDR
jgi:hypothetical protein